MSIAQSSACFPLLSVNQFKLNEISNHYAASDLDLHYICVLLHPHMTICPWIGPGYKYQIFALDSSVVEAQKGKLVWRIPNYRNETI